MRILVTNDDGIGAEGMDVLDRLWSETERGLIFANLVDFDMLFGHRRNVTGYAQALAEFDAWLPQFLDRVRPDDLVIITADHGNDPTFPGTDHTREYVPLIAFGPAHAAGVELGVRATFADVGATVADIFQVAAPPHGASFLRAIA